MKVKIYQTWAGPGGGFPAGSILEVTDDQGAELVRTRQAVEVKDEPAPAPNKDVPADAVKVEVAMVETPETAEWPSRRKKKE